MKLCACGCGGAIVARKWWRRWKGYLGPRFIPGHNTRMDAQKGRAHHRYVPRDDEIPSGRCECGCGGATKIAKVTLRAKRYFRGHPVPRLSGHVVAIRRGAASHKWKGGRISWRGYVLVYAPDHPDANARGYVFEHRLVMERVLGRRLGRHEVVHHRNQRKADNRGENLHVMRRSEHMRLHVREYLAARAAH